MSAYTPLDPAWANGPEGGTPINAARLQHMEAGIEAVDGAVDALALTVQANADDISALETATGGYNDAEETGSAIEVDLADGRVQRLVLDEATVAITVAGWPGAGAYGELILLLVQDGDGGNDVTYPSGTLWAGGTEPALTADGNAIDIVKLWSVDGGTTIFGEVIGLDMS